MDDSGEVAQVRGGWWSASRSVRGRGSRGWLLEGCRFGGDGIRSCPRGWGRYTSRGRVASASCPVGRSVIAMLKLNGIEPWEKSCVEKTDSVY
ncbi:MAG: hypothetical protein F6K09_14785 [Merismopedia sp. SIO2A8]|nr:hypothetical protein [Symploca sp. SIO2B6]NET49949.1 hypothetical protein [Merismopedia sp. SIO2A8]